jgi:hypothetical protein
MQPMSAAVPAQPAGVVTRPFRERFATCASCRAAARWLVNGTTSCDRHLALWQRRAAEAVK